MRGQIGFTVIEVVLVIAVVMIMVAVCVVTLSSARRTSKKDTCEHHVRQLALGCVMYADELSNNGRFPTTGGTPLHGLNLLYPTYIDDYRVFRCPSVRAEPPKQLAKLTGTLGQQPNLAPGLKGGNVTQYGYDDRHSNTDTDAALVADALGSSTADAEAGNSSNHGTRSFGGKVLGNGQYVAMTDGSTKWYSTTARETERRPDNQGQEHLFSPEDGGVRKNLHWDSFIQAR
jgi:type II secretory pathway pseudopilin PulG